MSSARHLAITTALLVTTLASPAFAVEPTYSIEDVQSCSSDAMRLCKDKIPDLEAIQQCMREHYDRLRPACKARFTR